MTSAGDAWKFGELEVPRPRGLVLVDLEKKEINAGIVVVGSGADAFVRHVHATTSDPEAPFVDAVSADEPSFLYLPVRLGDIRGYTTRLHLYGIREDARLNELLAECVPHATGIVIARSGHGGREAVVTEMQRLVDESGRIVPIHDVEVADDTVMPALKAVARDILASLRQE